MKVQTKLYILHHCKGIRSSVENHHHEHNRFGFQALSSLSRSPMAATSSTNTLAWSALPFFSLLLSKLRYLLQWFSSANPQLPRAQPSTTRPRASDGETRRLGSFSLIAAGGLKSGLMFCITARRSTFADSKASIAASDTR